jgi:hypothetical protein
MTITPIGPNASVPTAPVGYDGTVPCTDGDIRLLAGAEVYDGDGERVGTVADVGRGYFLVEDGLINIRSMYLPRTVVDDIDAYGVYLSVPRREAEAMARDTPSAEGDAWYGAAPTIVRVVEIPVREQVLATRTVATVKSEVHLRKAMTRHIARVAATVRREDVHVDGTASDRVHVGGAMGSADRGGVRWRADR